MPKKERVDLLLVERGLAESRSLAQRLVMAGQVRADGQLVDKPSTKVDEGAQLSIDRGPRFVSRGGDKLAAAFEIFALNAAEKICADVGASTGGFTDCLLQHGAAKVYAIDVGQGILHWKLRNDPRVAVMEGTNARFVEQLPEAVDLVTIDASFISLKILLPVVKQWLPTEARSDLLVLIKPQFEAGRKEVARGKGVVRDPEVHRRVLQDIIAFVRQEGYQIEGLARSPVLGPKGNVEFLCWLKYPEEPASGQQEFDQLISHIIESD